MRAITDRQLAQWWSGSIALLGVVALSACLTTAKSEPAGCETGVLKPCTCKDGSKSTMVCAGGAYGGCQCTPGTGDATGDSTPQDGGGNDATQLDSVLSDALQADSGQSEVAQSDAIPAEVANDATGLQETVQIDASGTIGCESDKDCKDLGKVCDPLTKACVACLSDAECGPSQHCLGLICQTYTACTNSLGCKTAQGPDGKGQPICDQAIGECSACVSAADCLANHDCKAKQCVPFKTCQNSKDCGEDAVCNKTTSRCVQCLGDNDCGTNELCEDGACRSFAPCSSDKQCTDKGQLCDNGKGKCAQCLKNSDCPGIYNCQPVGVAKTGQCVLDICAQGQGACKDNAKVTCNSVGDGYGSAQICPAQTSCAAPGGKPECKAWVCPAGASCQGDKAVQCSKNGLEVLNSTDCAASGQKCSAGSCKAQLCAPENAFCEGNAVKLCSKDGLSVSTVKSCGDKEFCDGGACKAQVCPPNKPACDGNDAKVCNGVGSGYVDAGKQCGSKEKCLAGQCKTVVCEAGKAFCDGQAIKQCDENGLTSNVTKTCSSSEFCESGACKAQICSPNKAVCDGNTAKVCKATGSGYVDAGKLCSNKEKCLAGVCKPLICVAAGQFCEAGKLKTCSPDGLSVTAEEACKTGTFCGANKLGDAGCQPNICEPAKTTCNGTVATTCKADGSGFEVGGVECKVQGKVCSEGLCKSLLCDPLAPDYCDLNTAMKCDASGLNPSVVKACGPGTYCEKGACLPQVCEPNKQVCNGNKPATCSANGNGYSVVGPDCGVGKTCSAGACVAQMCGNAVVEGAEACDDGNNAGGDACAVDCTGLTAPKEIKLLAGDLAGGPWLVRTVVSPKNCDAAMVTGQYKVVAASGIPWDASKSAAAPATAINLSKLSNPVTVSAGNAFDFAMVGRLPTNYQQGVYFKLVFPNGATIKANRWVWNGGSESAADCFVTDPTGKAVSYSSANKTTGNQAPHRPWGWYIMNDGGWFKFSVHVDTLADSITFKLDQPSLWVDAYEATYKLALLDSGAPTVELGGDANCDGANNGTMDGQIASFTALMPGKAGVCSAGAATCLGNFAGTCNPPGTGLTSATDCKSAGKTCSVGTCVAGYASCKAALTANPAAADGLYPIDPDGPGPIAAVDLFCDMKNGGLTLVANIFDSSGDDAPNISDYVVSGWQQTGSGKWDSKASKVDRNSSGSGSSAVSLEFVKALGINAGQGHLKMCFVSVVGAETGCYATDAGSLSLVSSATGNPKLTKYSDNKLTYTFGRLAGLAGTADTYDTKALTFYGACIPIAANKICEEASAPTQCGGIWHIQGYGMTYRPMEGNNNEFGACDTGGTATPDPDPNKTGFRLYIGSASSTYASCKAALIANPAAADGLYPIDPDGAGPIATANLFCDMKNGGLTLVANVFDSAGDDAPNSTSYVVSGWQQTASGAWANSASKVDRDASGKGSAAVSLAFVAALKASAGQQNLKMCFVDQNGADTVCRSSADGSMTLASYTTGNPKLTTYGADKLTYTYGRLAGLPGPADCYDTNACFGSGYCIGVQPGGTFGDGCGTQPGICGFGGVGKAVEQPGFVWHGFCGGEAYAPYRSGAASGLELTDPDPSGFRVFIGP